jgi:hypothetical protein
MSIHWNAAFTSRLRKVNDKAWGAITLAGNVPLGAYGTFDSNQEFNQLGVISLPASFTSSMTTAGDYRLADEGVKTLEQGASVSGSFRDPETQTDVSVGIEWAWGFSKSQSFLMQLPAVYATSYDAGISEVMDAAETELVEMANQYGWANSDGTVKQGFCLIVETLDIISGFVTGSNSANNTFKINGAADAINDLMSGSVQAAYSAASTTENDDMFTFIVPETPYVNGNSGSVATTNSTRTVGLVAATFNHKQVVYPYRG